MSRPKYNERHELRTYLKLDTKFRKALPDLPLHPGMDPAIETWVTCPKFERYEISSHGRVRTKRQHRLVRIRANTNGYALFSGAVRQPLNGWSSKWVVRRGHLAHCVVQAFFQWVLPPRTNPIRYRDGNKMNCRVDNLYYQTQSQVIAEQWRSGKRKQKCGIVRNPLGISKYKRIGSEAVKRARL